MKRMSSFLKVQQQQIGSSRRRGRRSRRHSFTRAGRHAQPHSYQEHDVQSQLPTACTIGAPVASLLADFAPVLAEIMKLTYGLRCPRGLRPRAPSGKPRHRLRGGRVGPEATSPARRSIRQNVHGRSDSLSSRCAQSSSSSIIIHTYIHTYHQDRHLLACSRWRCFRPRLLHDRFVGAPSQQIVHHLGRVEQGS